MKYSILADTISPSAILKISAAVKAQQAAGADIFNFTVGDFDPSIFPIPPELEDAVVNAYRRQLTNYPQSEGNTDLRKSLRQYHRHYQGIDYHEAEILVGSGGRPLIYTLFLSLVDPGDTVIFPVPSWNNHNYAEITGAVPVAVETSAADHFLPTAAAIEPYISKARLLALCSPQNPSGTVFSREALEGICRLVLEENRRRGADRKPLYIFFDQMYAQLVYGETKHYHPVALFPELRPYTITVDAISKSFAATGIRVGWCLGPAELLARMKGLLTHIGAWAPMPEQKGLAQYLLHTQGMDEFLKGFRSALQERLQAFYTGILRLRSKGYPVDAIPPSAAIYLSVEIRLSGLRTAAGTLLEGPEQVTDFILQEAGLALVPFYAFGASRDSSWYRLSVGTCSREAPAKVLELLETILAPFIKPIP